MTTTGQTSAILVMGGIRNYMGKLKSLVQFREKCRFICLLHLLVLSAKKIRCYWRMRNL